MITRRRLLGSITALGTNALAPLPAMALQEGEPSRTAQGAAFHRAAHQLLDTPLVFEDPLALKILGPARRKILQSTLDRRRTVRSRAMRALIVARSRFAEDELARAVETGTAQYVVLGAGLDTFALRNPFGERLQVFEVDHPSTQNWKRKQLADEAIELPPSVRLVAVDFEKDSLAARLQDSGFRRDRPVFISWLGVTIYLTRPAIMQTLGFVAASAPASRIVFDFATSPQDLRETDRGRHERVAARVAAIGEPWISYFDPQSLARDLLAMGFSKADSLGAGEINERYFKGRRDGLRMRGSTGRIMIAVT